MTKVYRILGKRGRVTIPYEIRKRVGFSCNDVLSFAEQDDRTVIVRREKLCNDCRKAGGHHASGFSGQPFCQGAAGGAHPSVGALGGAARR